MKVEIEQSNHNCVEFDYLGYGDVFYLGDCNEPFIKIDTTDSDNNALSLTKHNKISIESGKIVHKYESCKIVCKM